MTHYVLLGVVGLILLRGLTSGRDAYGAFLRGAKQGMLSAVGLLPALCGMLLLLRLMSASGLTRIMAEFASPLLEKISMPKEVTPMLLLRPLTGSGSIAALQEIIRQCGPDSRAASIASVLAGSSETILYTLTVYAAAAGVTKVPGALAASLVGYAASVAVALMLCQ